MTTPDTYADWDAAYVLGALSTSERHEYERHLVDCADCARMVAELAALPGLLGTVPHAEALELDRREDESHLDEPRSDADHVSVPRLSEQSLPRLMDRMRRRRRRLRVLVVGVLVAVAGVSAAVVLVLPTMLPGAEPGAGPGGGPVAARTIPPSATAPSGAEPAASRTVMQQVVPSPLSASFVLTGRPWGTRIDSSCSYAETGTGSAPRAYSMYVTDARGTVTLVATWLAGPGTAIEAVGTTSVAESDIEAVDIRLEPDGVVLLTGRPKT